jgi:FAD-dependent urate hydroxylase
VVTVQTTSLLVIGAGPYGLSTAAFARERGIDTVILGRPMAFWHENMPAGMFLRSGPDWHLDASGVDTFEAFVEERGIAAGDVDPIPLATYVDYADWFRSRKWIEVQQDLVAALTKPDGRFEALLESGDRIAADAVVAAPGIRHFANLPPWAGEVPPGRSSHTCEHVRFDDLSGARVLIVGGRQSAYEWAALIGEAGAERIDVVHRHPVPKFERVSWRFVDELIENTLKVPGWWRKLPKEEQEGVAKHFWEVGRLTLEWWLSPRLAAGNIQKWPGTEVVEVASAEGGNGDVVVKLLSGDELSADHVIFASGYKADLTRVPYLEPLLGRIDTADGFPVLNEHFGSNLAGLYLTGFAATRDFGPFFGFVKGSPAAATLIVQDLLSRTGESEAGGRPA